MKRSLPHLRMALALAMSVPLAAIMASGTAAASAAGPTAARHHGRFARPV